ncbi:MAG: Uma2 family endonuclease [Gammaproteobacteria bacterium]|nr:Uma2 family endonuclease [Gammaproteobacteria bacterium]
MTTLTQVSENLPAIPVCSEMEDGPLMGSRNHSYVQVNLAVAFAQLEQFVVFAELSLEIDSKEYKPDICLYSEKHEPRSLAEDIVRETQLPLLAVEILSPRQAMMDIMAKFKVYFNAGIPSAWIVIPSGHTVLMYSDLDTVQAFSSGEVVDKKVNLRLPLERIFRQKQKKSGTGQ